MKPHNATPPLHDAWHSGTQNLAEMADASHPDTGAKHWIKALIDGVWHDRLQLTSVIDARLAAVESGFRDNVTEDGASGFKAEPGRYHLYASYACPWAHRTLIYRRLKRLENVIPLSVLHPRWAGPGGWHFADGSLSTIDHVGGRQFLHEVYRAACPDFTGRVSVPVLWDRKRQTIVSNESADIIRMFNSAFDAFGDTSVDFYPRAQRGEIDKLNAWMIPNLCQGVYRAGFAASQVAYEDAVSAVFETLDELELRLARHPYLLGDRPTESDWHLFATLCRFDAVYFSALKCNLRRLIDYPALTAFAQRMHRIPGVAETVRFDHFKLHYYDAIGEISPTIVPTGPAMDYTTVPDGAGERVFRHEVFAMHEYLEAWLKGRVADRGSGPRRLDEALADDFIVVHPTGNRDGKPEVIRNFSSAYGTRPDGYALEVNELSLRMLGERMCLATYREDHRGEPGRSRISTALLRQAAHERVEWASLHETFLIR